MRSSELLVRMRRQWVSRKRVVGKRLVDVRVNLVGGDVQLHLPQIVDDLAGLGLGRLNVLGGMDRLEHRRHLAHLAARHDAEHVAVEVHHTTLPARRRVVLAQTFHQARARVGDEGVQPGYV